MDVPCMRCKKRTGTEIWCPGGGLAYVHGAYWKWCLICVIEEQLKVAREMAEAIPGLEAKLVEARKAAGSIVIDDLGE